MMVCLRRRRGRRCQRPLCVSGGRRRQSDCEPCRGCGESEAVRCRVCAYRRCCAFMAPCEPPGCEYGAAAPPVLVRSLSPSPSALVARAVRQRVEAPVVAGSAGAARCTAIDVDVDADLAPALEPPMWRAAERPAWVPGPSAQTERRLEALQRSMREASGDSGPGMGGPGAGAGGAEAPVEEPVFDPELGVAPRFTVGTGGAVMDGAHAVHWPWESDGDQRPPASPVSVTDREIGMEPSRDGAPAVDVVARDFLAAPTPLSSDALGSNAADATVLQGLRASTADGSGGGNSTGVRAYKRFCALHKRAVLRPVDPNAPLWVKLSEEVWAMRFIAHLVDDRTVSAATARAYFGAASAWHLRETGIGFAAGMNMKRLAEMVKGLKKLRDGPPAHVRLGISPQLLREGMDRVFPPTSAENVNVRAMLAVGLQGLMRGRELGCEGTFDAARDLARGDLATCTARRLAMFIRPAKNMRHRRGKTVPLVIGGGGEFIDACEEVRRMLLLDPTPAGEDASTPMFRKPDGGAHRGCR